MPNNTCAYQEKLRHLQDDMDQLSYVVSHDLREPLTGIMGFATLLQRRCADQLGDDCRRFLEQTIERAKAMEAKLDDLITFSRAGQITNPKPFPLGAAIEEARRALVRTFASTQGVVEVESELPVVLGERSLIAQVFQNLFSNSLKYRQKGQRPVIRIRVEPDDHPHQWRISVADNGIGFDLRHQERIFGVFQRLYTVDQYPGTGIGLAIVKRIIERHGGTIWPWSKPGQGAVFKFTLPASDTDHQAHDCSSHPPRR